VADSLRVWLASITTVRRQGQPQVNLTYMIKFSALCAAHTVLQVFIKKDTIFSVVAVTLPPPPQFSSKAIKPFLSHSLSSLSVAGRDFA
jgi:hypothetical protein